MNAVIDTALSATVTVSDATYARFTRFFNTTDITGYERAESAFLNTRSDSADHVIHKLQLAESYFDESGCDAERDITRVVIDLVRQGEIDNAIYYATAIANSDTVEDYCADPIRSAIADLQGIN